MSLLNFTTEEHTALLSIIETAIRDDTASVPLRTAYCKLLADNPSITGIAPIKPKKTKKALTIDAAEFWGMHAAAVRRMVEAHGPAWRSNVPHETVEVTLPARLCTCVGPLGGRIRWRRDHRMPAPSYWSDGSLPDGVEALPVAPRYDGPMGDDHPLMRGWHKTVTEAHEMRYGGNHWAHAARPPMLTAREAYDEAARMHFSGEYDEDDVDAMMCDES